MPGVPASVIRATDCPSSMRLTSSSTTRCSLCAWYDWRRLLQAKVLQQVATGAGVLGENQVDVGQYTDSPEGDVFQVADRRGYQHQFCHAGCQARKRRSSRSMNASAGSPLRFHYTGRSIALPRTCAQPGCLRHH